MGVLFSLLKLPANSDVCYLFRPKLKFVEIFFKFLLNIKGIHLHERHMQFNVDGKNIYKKHTKLTDALVEGYIKSLDVDWDVLGSYFKLRISQLVFQDVSRSLSIINFIRECAYFKNINRVYISQKYLGLLIENEGRDINLVVYKSFGKVGDENYQASYSPNRYQGLMAKLKYFSSLLANLLRFMPVGWRKDIKVSALFFLHFNSNERKYFGHESIVNKFDSIAVITNDLRVEYKGEKYFVNRMSLSCIHKYFLWLLQGRRLFSFTTKINPFYKMILLVEWSRLYFIKSMLSKLDVKLIYSCYESSNAMLFQYAAKSLGNCVSLASVYSLGYFPVKYEFTHQSKFADVFFTWGEYQAKLYKYSGDQSTYYVCTGYVGDMFKSEFQRIADSLKKKIKKQKTIAVYDTSYSYDIFLDVHQAVEFINVVMEVAMQQDAVVIVKTKKGKNIYSDLIAKYGDRIIIMDEMASLAPSMCADVTVGYFLPTPAVISGVWGRNIILYDPDKMIWSEWYSRDFGDVVVHSFKDLNKKLSAELVKESIKKDFSFIDPFGDGHAQDRIYNYINTVIENVDKGNVAALKLANDKYRFKYGSTKVINNDVNLSR